MGGCYSDHNLSKEIVTNETKDEFLPQVKIMGLCGNISAGKSVFLNEIAKQVKDTNPEIHVVFEPVDEWSKFKNSEGISILEAFYKKPDKMAFEFQIYALHTRFETLTREIEIANIKSKCLGKPVILFIERSILDDFYIFASMLYNDKKMTEFQMMVYKKWFDTYSKQFNIEKVIYLQTLPKICFDRVSIRNRDGESNIELKYLEACHSQHEDFYSNILINHNCLVINNNFEFDSDEYCKSIKESIEHLLK